MSIVQGNTSLENVSSISGNGLVGINQNANGIVQFPNNPRFDAYGSGTSATSDSYWIFPTVMVNNGNHYNASTGIFTAPTDGVYYFYWTNIGGNSDDVFRYYIYFNDVQERDVHLRLDTLDSGSEYGSNGIRKYIRSLSTGDTARIYYRSDSGGSSYPGNSSSNSYPTFGGFLLTTI